MATTQNTYTGNGSLTEYSFTFPYLEESDVRVSLDGVDQLTTAYSFANATTISFNTAPANGVAIRIYRQTAQDAPPATFFAGSAIRASDLNENFLQTLYVAQETDQIARNLTAGDIAPGGITNAQLADDAVTTVKIADLNVTTAKIADLNVTTAKIADLNVTTGKLANSAVTSAKIADGTIVNADVNASAAIAGTKVSPDFGSQNITTTGDVSGDNITATGDATIGSLNGGQLAGTRNRIINGDMRIDQRNAGASVTPTAGTYTLDRWYCAMSVTSKYSVARSTTAPTRFTNSALVTSLSAYTVGASETFNIQQVIEGFNVADLNYGTASAVTTTLSFWVRSSLTGTFGGAIQNGSGNRSYPFTFSISAANTFEYKTVVIAGDTSGTWPSDNTGAMVVIFSLGTGSTISGTAGSWSGNNYKSATGATSVVGTNGATFYITGVQLEVGSVATPFERRSYGQELALCQRYYEKQAVTLYSGALPLPYFNAVSMRATPTITGGGAGFIAANASPRYALMYQSGQATQTLEFSIEL